jgi:hypothetical protein
MFKDLLARFKKVFTVADWQKEARDAMSKQEFVIASLEELHRVEAAEGPQSRARQPIRDIPQQQYAVPTKPKYAQESALDDARRKKASETSLAQLMEAVRLQQNG